MRGRGWLSFRLSNKLERHYPKKWNGRLNKMDITEHAPRLLWPSRDHSHHHHRPSSDATYDLDGWGAYCVVKQPLLDQ